MAKFATNTSGAMLWSNLQLMQIVPSGGQMCNECKWRHLVAKFAIDASGAMLLPNLIHVTESISGSVVPLAMFHCFVAFYHWLQWFKWSRTIGRTMEWFQWIALANPSHTFVLMVIGHQNPQLPVNQLMLIDSLTQ